METLWKGPKTMEFSFTQTYQTCDFCREQNHADDVFGHSKGRVVCRWCFPKIEHELHCDECGFTFAAQGIALECPVCGCLRLSHEYAASDRLLKELQLQERERRNAEPTKQVRSTKVEVRRGAIFYLSLPTTENPKL